MSIGTNIKKRRFELNMTQEELAFRMGYKTRSTIAKIESGENAVTSKKLLEFAKILDTTVEKLVSGAAAPELMTDGPAHAIGDRKNVVIIQAGGKSTRNQQNVPNQFVNVLGKPVIIYAMETYQRHPSIHEIYVVCLKGWEEILRSYCKQYRITKLKGIITAGESGILSVKNSIDYLRPRCSEEDLIIFQEANRPLVTDEMISRLLWNTDDYGSAITVEPMNDYLQFLNEEPKPRLIDRNKIVCMQSPEAYKFAIIRQLFDDAAAKKHVFNESCLPLFLYNMGYKLHFYEGTHNNIKILRQEDVAIFSALIKVKRDD